MNGFPSFVIPRPADQGFHQVSHPHPLPHPPPHHPHPPAHRPARATTTVMNGRRQSIPARISLPPGSPGRNRNNNNTTTTTTTTNGSSSSLALTPAQRQHIAATIPQLTLATAHQALIASNSNPAASSIAPPAGPSPRRNSATKPALNPDLPSPGGINGWAGHGVAPTAANSPNPPSPTSNVPPSLSSQFPAISQSAAAPPPIPNTGGSSSESPAASAVNLASSTQGNHSGSTNHLSAPTASNHRVGSHALSAHSSASSTTSTATPAPDPTGLSQLSLTDIPSSPCDPGHQSSQ